MMTTDADLSRALNELPVPAIAYREDVVVQFSRQFLRSTGLDRVEPKVGQPINEWLTFNESGNDAQDSKTASSSEQVFSNFELNTAILSLPERQPIHIQAQRIMVPTQPIATIVAMIYPSSDNDNSPSLRELLHELSQPLSAIHNFSSACHAILRQPDLDDHERCKKIEGWLARIAEGSESASSLIAEMRARVRQIEEI